MSGAFAIDQTNKIAPVHIGEQEPSEIRDRTRLERIKESRPVQFFAVAGVCGGLALGLGGEVQGIGLDFAKGGCGGPKTPFPKM